MRTPPLRSKSHVEAESRLRGQIQIHLTPKGFTIVFCRFITDRLGRRPTSGDLLQIRILLVVMGGLRVVLTTVCKESALWSLSRLIPLRVIENYCVPHAVEGTVLT